MTAAVTGEVRLLSFKRSRATGRYAPTRGWSSWHGHVSVMTGQLVERTNSGWRVVAEPPDIDTPAVLAFLQREGAR